MCRQLGAGGKADGWQSGAAQRSNRLLMSLKQKMMMKMMKPKENPSLQKKQAGVIDSGAQDALHEGEGQVLGHPRQAQRGGAQARGSRRGQAPH